LGGERASRRYERREGRPPKNRFGESMFAMHVGRTLRYVRSHPDLDLLEASPRYLPRFARGIVRVPWLREVATWNLELLVRRRR
ncbi:MAG: SAM-dependent methyltransferase, partial [Acidimicrobiales bacterium]